MHEYIIASVEKVLKDYGVDWILQERGSDFKRLIADIEIALSKVLD